MSAFCTSCGVRCLASCGRANSGRGPSAPPACRIDPLIRTVSVEHDLHWSDARRRPVLVLGRAQWVDVDPSAAADQNIPSCCWNNELDDLIGTWSAVSAGASGHACLATSPTDDRTRQTVAQRNLLLPTGDRLQTTAPLAFFPGRPAHWNLIQRKDECGIEAAALKTCALARSAAGRETAATILNLPLV